MTDLFEFLHQPSWVSLAGAFAAYVVLSLAMLPVWPVTIFLGSIYGIWGGLLIAMPASVAGALAVFVLGQSVLRDWARRRMAGWDRLEAITRVVGDEHGWIPLLLRLSPVVPFNLINYALSLTDLRLGVYFVTTVVGILPATVMYLYMGATTASVARARLTAAELTIYVVGLIATVLAVWLIGRAVRKSLDAQLPPGGRHS
jgi:uncharacterized membrane protein YdjX (TVP38/TMEM64 family)